VPKESPGGIDASALFLAPARGLAATKIEKIHSRIE